MIDFQLWTDKDGIAGRTALEGFCAEGEEYACTLLEDIEAGKSPEDYD